MTDNEIIKDLKVWVDLSELTEKPPFVTHEFLQQLLDLINRQKAEIDRYKGVIEILEKDVADARNEGVKELAHSLIDKAEKGIVWACDVVDLCHNLTNVLPEEGTDV